MARVWLRAQWLAVLVAAYVLSSVALGHALTPDASARLAGTPEAFLATCRTDLDDTRKQVAQSLLGR